MVSRGRLPPVTLLRSMLSKVTADTLTDAIEGIKAFADGNNDVFSEW